MLELSRKGGRVPENPLTQADESRPSMRWLVGALIIVIIAISTYSSLKSTNDTVNVNGDTAADTAAAPPRAPYSALRSDQADPRLSGLERAQQAAAARMQATGGQTANAGQNDTRTGKIDQDVSGAEAQGSQADYTSSLQSRLGTLTAEFGSVKAQLAQKGDLKTIEALEQSRASAVAKVESVSQPGTTNWQAMRGDVDRSLDDLQRQLESAKAAAH